VGAAARGYLALARHDSAEALRDFVALPDSLCRMCYLDQHTTAELLAARGRYHEAAVPLEAWLGRPAYEPILPGNVLRALERGRVNEGLGEREKAIRAYRFVVDVWRHADPELQPYVAEARAALARLGEEPRRGEPRR
jgi:tetratricopeptide (TPR) repeat protein